jgi:hypothetical protein
MSEAKPEVVVEAPGEPVEEPALADPPVEEPLFESTPEDAPEPEEEPVQATEPVQEPVARTLKRLEEEGITVTP